MTFNINTFFERASLALFYLLLGVLLIGISIGLVKLIFSVSTLLFKSGITGNYIPIISDVLTLLILIELSRSIASYFEHSRIRLVYIADAAIVFIIREIMIKMFKNNMPPAEIYAVSALLLVLTAIRVVSIIHEAGVLSPKSEDCR